MKATKAPDHPKVDDATKPEPAPAKSWRQSPEEIEAMEMRVLDEALRQAGLKT